MIGAAESRTAGILFPALTEYADHLCTGSQPNSPLHTTSSKTCGSPQQSKACGGLLILKISTLSPTHETSHSPPARSSDNKCLHRTSHEVNRHHRPQRSSHGNRHYSSSGKISNSDVSTRSSIQRSKALRIGSRTCG